MATTTDFKAWAAAHQQRIETQLQAVLPSAEVAPLRLHQAMRYAALGGGKRVRPLLAFAAGEMTGGDEERVAIAGAAVELIHAYSLVHDDLPCMDDDVLRRGKPTCHVEFDEATALLVGDALQSLAFQLLSEYRLTEDPAAQLEMVKLLAGASGSRGMAGGQAIDLEAVKQLMALKDDWGKAADSPAREAVWEKILTLWSDQMFTIGIVSGVEQLVAVSAKLQNVPEQGIFNFDPGAYFGMYRPDTFWFAE